MQIILDETDLTKLKPSTRADLLAHLFPAKGKSPEGSDKTGAAGPTRVKGLREGGRL